MKITPGIGYINVDGKWIATSTDSGLVKLWDMTAGKQVKTLEYPSQVVDIFYSPRDFIMGALDASGRINLTDLKSFNVASKFTDPAVKSRRF